MLPVPTRSEHPPRVGQQQHVLVSQTCLSNFLITCDPSRFLEAALTASDSELALSVITEGKDIAATRQPPREVLAREHVLDAITAIKLRTNSLRQVNAVHVRVSLEESGTVLARGRFSKAALAINVGAPGIDLPILREDQTVILTRYDLLYL